MTKCQCREGFFTLRDCEQAATANCSKCGRAVCSRHFDRTPPGGGLCVECAGIEEQEGRLPPAKATTGGSFGGRSFYRRRDEFYRSHAHRPVYWGVVVDPYSDRYDVWSFHYHHHHDHVIVTDDGSDRDVAASLMDS